MALHSHTPAQRKKIKAKKKAAAKTPTRKPKQKSGRKR